MEKTKNEVAAFCQTVRVPNYEQRLNTKNEDFIHDLALYIISPNTENNSIAQIRDKIDFLLNYESFDTATEALKLKGADSMKQKIIDKFTTLFKGNENVTIEVIDLLGKGENPDAVEFDRKVAEAGNLSAIEKISKLLSIGHKLGKPVTDSAMYDRLHDLEIENRNYFNMIYVAITDMMRDNHYKECNCVGIKFDSFIYSNSKEEVIKKVMR